jgi:adenosylhomocysteine nucleosidase
VIHILVALEQEFPIKFDSKNLIIKYTGVGKINATVAAMESCLFGNCTEIINYGTAGALNKAIIGKLISIGTLYQRDMDARPLAKLGYTPFDNNGGPIVLNESPFTLSTGDNFVTSIPEIVTDAVDMEAYAIAKVCQLYNKPFHCYKYLTDFADENAAMHWQENINKGISEFLDKLEW